MNRGYERSLKLGVESFASQLSKVYEEAKANGEDAELAEKTICATIDGANGQIERPYPGFEVGKLKYRIAGRADHSSGAPSSVCQLADKKENCCSVWIIASIICWHHEIS